MAFTMKSCTFYLSQDFQIGMGRLEVLCSVACMLISFNSANKGMLEETMVKKTPPESVTVPLHDFSFPFFQGKGLFQKF